MGYLVKSTFLTKTLVIPEADVQLLHTAPYTILSGIPGIYLQPIVCIVQIMNNSINAYAGFSNLYLEGLSPIGTLDETNNILGNQYSNAILINVDHPPTTPGGTSKAGIGLSLRFGSPISAGDGDMKVILYYIALPEV